MINLSLLFLIYTYPLSWVVFTAEETMVLDPQVNLRVTRTPLLKKGINAPTYADVSPSFFVLLLSREKLT